MWKGWEGGWEGVGALEGRGGGFTSSEGDGQREHRSINLVHKSIMFCS